jgi:hypothetical protein
MGFHVDFRFTTFRVCAVAAVLAALAAITPVGAQFPSTPDDPGDPPAAAHKGKKGAPPPAAASGPNITGNWVGQLSQVGSQTPYNFEIAISAKGAETKYPDLDCIGKLNRVGSSKSYVFFVEVITKGQAEKGGRCPDGTLTVARQGNDLAVGWFGSIHDATVVAYGTLKKK